MRAEGARLPLAARFASLAVMSRSLALVCLLTCFGLTAAAAPSDAPRQRAADDQEEPQVILPPAGSPVEEQQAPGVAAPAAEGPSKQEPRMEPSTRGSQAEEQEAPRIAAHPPGLQAEDQEQPRIAPPRPAPTELLTPHLALAAVLRARGGFGFDLCLYPLERLKLGVELSTALWVSEAGLYARYAIVHGARDDVDLGVRLQGLSVLLDPSHEQAALELAWEERFGSNLFGIDLEYGVRRDGMWLPRDPAAITGGVRLGHFW
jgi:hypothetical protein